MSDLSREPRGEREHCDFYVVDEDGESMHVQAPDAQAAAQMAVDEWGLEAAPGYRFRVFAAEDAKHFEFKLIVSPFDGDPSDA